MAATGKSALIIGATGATGKHLPRELLASPHFSRVGEFGRRVTPADSLPKDAHVSEKLQQKVIDFENIKAEEWKEGRWDVVFVTLGTTRATAGSAEAFVKIDKDYVVSAAKAAKLSEGEQRIVYLSSAGTNANSSFLYPKTKGQTEIELANIGYTDTIVFRPALLANAERGGDGFRLGETIALVAKLTSSAYLSTSLSRAFASHKPVSFSIHTTENIL